jgi:hypothetical protein
MAYPPPGRFTVLQGIFFQLLDLSAALADFDYAAAA